MFVDMIPQYGKPNSSTLGYNYSAVNSADY
jgi:hypothetical protein